MFNNIIYNYEVIIIFIFLIGKLTGTMTVIILKYN